MTDIISNVLFTLLIVPIPLVIMLGPGPAQHGSWWYPNPDRWDYPFKLRIYAIMDLSTPKDPIGRWVVRGIAIVILVVSLALTWIGHPGK